MEETGVFHVCKFQTFAGVSRFPRLHENPEIRLCACSWELVLTDAGSPGHLPVDEDILIVHFCQHIVEDRRKLVLCVRDIDLNESGAVEETVQVLL